jgi:hypothetical protein
VGLNIDEILASLENEKTAEEIFKENLIGKKTEEVEEKKEAEAEAEAAEESKEAEEAAEEKMEAEKKVDEALEANEEVEEAEEVKETKEAEAEEKSEDSDLRKQAEELDVQGRIMARGFFDELKKLSAAEEDAEAEIVEGVAEETKEAEEAGTRILTNLYNRFYGQN